MTLGSSVKTCVGDGLALSACLLCCLWQSVCQTCTVTKSQKCFEGGFSFSLDLYLFHQNLFRLMYNVCNISVLNQNSSKYFLNNFDITLPTVFFKDTIYSVKVREEVDAPSDPWFQPAQLLDLISSVIISVFQPQAMSQTGVLGKFKKKRHSVMFYALGAGALTRLT